MKSVIMGRILFVIKAPITGPSETFFSDPLDETEGFTLLIVEKGKIEMEEEEEKSVEETRNQSESER